MRNYYSHERRFYVAVDCIIFGFSNNKLTLLLLKRNFQPAKGDWSLMGGFVGENESADDAARRVLAELTGLDDVYMEQAGVFGEVNRDPGGRVISIAYYALVHTDHYDKKLVRQHNAYWADINELPELIFDHKEMVDQARKQLRKKASTEPIGFNLLPELFTLTQLQKLYEVIYNEELDKRNFRNKIATMKFIEKTDRIDKVTSKRGAALYRFNESLYKKEGHFKI